MTWLMIWLVSIVVAVKMANDKKQSVWLYFILSVITGPLAVIILLLISPPQKILQKHSGSSQGIYTLDDMRRELTNLRMTMENIQERIGALEFLLNKVSGVDVPSTTVLNKDIGDPSHMTVTVATPAKEMAQAPTAVPAKPLDMEMYFGRNWLSKIGIVVFTVGMVFLISYTFKYFGPAIKILFGYAVSVLFFFFGKKLERNEKFADFGRVVWGGGWAIAYFTTYAAHHFEASRVINDPYVSLALQLILVIGLLAYVFKYRNEDMMSIALFAAYIAATMGRVTNFTLLSCLLLAGIILFLVYKFQWIKTLALGIILTYGIHQIWVVPNMYFPGGTEQILWWTIASGDYAQLMNLTFLSIYALVFLTAAHIARTQDIPKLKDTVAGINFGNIAIFSFLAYPLVNNFFHAQRFLIVFFIGAFLLGLALFMKMAGRERLYQSDLITGLFMMTFALPLKFTGLSGLMLWLIEIPFLLFVAVRFKERIYAYLAYGLTLFWGGRFLFSGSLGEVNIAGLLMTGKDFHHLCVVIAMGASFYILRKANGKAARADVDYFFEHLYTAAACLHSMLLLDSLVKESWTSLIFSLAAMALLILSHLTELKRFRVYAYMVFTGTFFVFYDQQFAYLMPAVKWTIIVGNSLLAIAAYGSIKHFNGTKPVLEISKIEVQAVFCMVLMLLTAVIFQHFPARSISLVLGLAAVALIIAGVTGKDKTERLGGLILFGITLCRVVFIDLSGLDVIFKIITFIVLGLLFLGASYVYNRFGTDK